MYILLKKTITTFFCLLLITACIPSIENGEQGYLSFASQPDSTKFGYSIMLENDNGQFIPILPLVDSFTEFTWSPNGGQVAVIKYQSITKCDIVIVNLKGGKELNITKGINACNRQPVWSPDGKYIAFVSLINGHEEIFIIKVDNSELQQLTKNKFCVSDHPDWSPSGQQIVFESRCKNKNSIYKIDINGENLIRLTSNNGGDITPKWSPNGEEIIFVSDRDGNNEIYKMNSDGSDQINLTNSLWWEYGPVWSLDGKKIAFESVREGDPSRSFRLQGYRTEIFIMNSDGSEQTQITDNKVFDVSPEWKP